jgi:hypothetical protein
MMLNILLELFGVHSVKDGLRWLKLTFNILHISSLLYMEFIRVWMSEPKCKASN